MIKLSKEQLLRPDVLLFLACIAIFLIWPRLDLAVTDQFYNQGFHWNENFLVQAIYKIFAKIHFLYLLVFIGLITYTHKTAQLKLKKQSTYLLCCLLLGPGILVNIILKDNSIGRPRPVHIENYGGEARFSPAFYYSGACRKNCSFVSGHAAIGYFFMALAWAFQRRYWLYIGIASGLAIGLVRIVQGGHFLSDVIFAGWFTYFLYAGLGRAFKLTINNKPIEEK